MKNNVKWELNSEIVARHFLKNVSVRKYHHTPEGGSYFWKGGPALNALSGKDMII